jgi:hypothetical protein
MVYAGAELYLARLPLENTSEKVLETGLMLGICVFVLAIVLVCEEGQAGLILDTRTAPAFSLLERRSRLHQQAVPDVEGRDGLRCASRRLALATPLHMGRGGSKSACSSPQSTGVISTFDQDRWRLCCSTTSLPTALLAEDVSECEAQVPLYKRCLPLSGSSCSTIGWNCMLRKLVRSERCLRRL